MQRPKISIMTACFNAERTIEQTIKSVLDQNYPDLEYIIVDGASTDGTMDIVRRYQDRISKIISEPDRGIYDAFNKGVRAASGDVIGILNADDFYSPKCFEEVVRACEESPDADIYYGKIVVVDEKTREWKVYPIGTPNGLHACMSISHPAVFVRRNAYERYGAFDESFEIAGDWDLMLRMYESGAKFSPIDKALTAFRTGGASSEITPRHVTERNRIFREHLPRVTASKMIIKTYIKDLIRSIMLKTGTYKYYASYRDANIMRLERNGDLSPESDIWS